MDKVLTILATEQVALSTTAAPNTADAANARTLRVCADVAHFIKLDGTATAANGAYMPANVPYLLNVGAGVIVSMILATGTGKATLSSVKLS